MTGKLIITFFVAALMAGAGGFMAFFSTDSSDGYDHPLVWTARILSAIAVLCMVAMFSLIIIDVWQR